MVKEAILTLIKLDKLFLLSAALALVRERRFSEATMLLRAVWKLMREVHERNANENSNGDAADDEFVLCPKKHVITEKTKGPHAMAVCGICNEKKPFRNSESYHQCQKCDFKCCSDECYEKGNKATDKTILQRLTTAVNSLITGSRFFSLQNDDDDGIDEKSELGKHKKVYQDVFKHISKDPIFSKSTATTCAKHFKYHVSKDKPLADEIAVLEGAIGKVEGGGELVIKKPNCSNLKDANDVTPSIKHEINEMLKTEKPEDETIANELVTTKLLPIWKERLPPLQQQLQQLQEQRKKFLGSKSRSLNLSEISSYNHVLDAKSHYRSENIYSAFRADSSKAVEETIEYFIANSLPLNLFSWLRFLQDYHPVTYITDFTLLLNCCWTLATDAKTKSTRESQDNATFTSLQKSIEEFATAMMENRTLLPIIMNDSKGLELQHLASTGIFQKVLLEISAQLNIMPIYKVEVFIFVVHMFTFSYTTYHFKFANEPVDILNSYRYMAATILNCLLALLFLLREYYQYSAMKSIGNWKKTENRQKKTNLASNYTGDPWNYIDVISSFLSLAVTIYYFVAGSTSLYDHLASVASLFLWLKFLGLIKAISQQIATFTLMLTTIFKDMQSFMIVLLVVVFGFGHAIFLMEAVYLPTAKDYEDKLDDCQIEDSVVCGNDLFETMNNDKSFNTAINAFQTLYAMVLGDFNVEIFTSPYSRLLGQGFMFAVVVCMLNVLIAIVGDSYEAAMTKSTELHWRAQFELITEISTTFKNLAKKSKKILDFVEKLHDSMIKLISFMFSSNDEHQRELEQTTYPVFLRKALKGVFFLPMLALLLVELIIILIFVLPMKWLLKLFVIVPTTSTTSTTNSNNNSTMKTTIVYEDTNKSDWGGRVLDISRRINERTKIESERVMAELRSENDEAHASSAALKAELESVRSSQAESKAELENVRSSQAETSKTLEKMMNLLQLLEGSKREMEGGKEEEEEEEGKDNVERA
ncbi:hypothetical protein ScalyP_jg3086 [Parmales sp. scaly parma]|nr:hypothetical protein ScalyP_jg3086 [Parmales sp. scaly parma]